jgi:hypothetical protein
LSSGLYPENNDEVLKKAFKFLKSSVSMPPALHALFRPSDKHINPSNSDFSLGCGGDCLQSKSKCAKKVSKKGVSQGKSVGCAVHKGARLIIALPVLANHYGMPHVARYLEAINPV